VVAGAVVVGATVVVLAAVDAVVSAGFLARLGARIGTRPGDNGFTYGFLMADELSTAQRIRASLTT